MENQLRGKILAAWENIGCVGQYQVVEAILRIY
jgi:hypothetical protein